MYVIENLPHEGIRCHKNIFTILILYLHKNLNLHFTYIKHLYFTYVTANAFTEMTKKSKVIGVN